MDYLDEVKNRARSAIRFAAKEHLAPLGLVQPGSSPRFWYADHGWWMINVEFQPSSGAVSTYLNIGLQYPWDGVDHHYFAYGYRRRVSRRTNASLGAFESDAEVGSSTDAFARRAADIVVAYRGSLMPECQHLEALATYVDNGQRWWNRAMALVLLGQYPTAASLVDQIRQQRQEWLERYLEPVLGKSGRPLKRPKYYENGKASRIDAVARAEEMQRILADHPDKAHPWIEDQIRHTRQKLKLPADAFELPPPPKQFTLRRPDGNVLEDLAKL